MSNNIDELSTLHVVGCGGAGIAICDSVVSKVAKLGEGFVNIKTYYIDTSLNNYNKMINTADKAGMHLVESISHGGAAISGSGSIRGKNMPDIMESVKLFLDKNNLSKPKTGDYVMVISSGSGGSGSVISPLITNILLDNKIPTIVTLIGDSSNGLNAKNTMNTIASFNSIAVNTRKKPLVVMYYNNDYNKELNTLDRIKSINEMFLTELTSLAIFLSGDNSDIDSQDMINLIDQSNYGDKIKILPGLYRLSVLNTKYILPKEAIPLIGRTLVSGGESPDIKLNLLHHKHGQVHSKNPVTIYKDIFPIHIVTYSGVFEANQSILKSIVDDYDNIGKSIVSTELKGVENSIITDTGLIL